MTQQDPGEQLIQAMAGEGYTFFTGVPCCLLKGVVTVLERKEGPTYVPAPREDVAVALAVGACLGGAGVAVLMPSAGVGAAMTALASLCLSYGVPVMLVVGRWSDTDAHHLESPLAGLVEELLERLDIPAFELPRGDVSGLPKVVAEAADCIRRTRRPAALLVREGVLT